MTGTLDKNLSAAFSSIATAVKCVAEGTAAVADNHFQTQFFGRYNTMLQLRTWLTRWSKAPGLRTDLADAKTAITVIATAMMQWLILKI